VQAEGTTELRTDVGFASMSLLAPPRAKRDPAGIFFSLSLSLSLSLSFLRFRLSPSRPEESGTRNGARNVAQGTLARASERLGGEFFAGSSVIEFIALFNGRTRTSNDRERFMGRDFAEYQVSIVPYVFHNGPVRDLCCEPSYSYQESC
jgi:hypothetical protein